MLKLIQYTFKPVVACATMPQKDVFKSEPEVQVKKNLITVIYCGELFSLTSYCIKKSIESLSSIYEPNIVHNYDTFLNLLI